MESSSTATNTPITPARFAAALPALPLSALHAKAAELQNAIAHLRSSNVQLREFADGGDAECADAMRENEEVIARMQERIALVRQEVEGRGMRWADGEVEDRVEENGVVEMNGAGAREERPGLSDEELERRLRERLGDGEDEEDGVHL